MDFTYNFLQVTSPLLYILQVTPSVLYILQVNPPLLYILQVNPHVLYILQVTLPLPTPTTDIRLAATFTELLSLPLRVGCLSAWICRENMAAVLYTW